MIDWLDFKSIKREVKLESVLRPYREELRRSGKDQYRGCCPIHRGEGREAFHVNLARNVFHCFACGAGGTVLDLVAAMERCSLYEAAQKLRTMAASSGRSRLSPNEKELVTKRRKVSLPLTFTLREVNYAHPYLADRGISPETALEFGVGFYAGPGLMSGRLVIPIHNASGDLIAYCGRCGSDRASIPSPAEVREVGDPLQYASRGGYRGKRGCRSGRLLRLHEIAPGRHTVRGGSDGIRAL